MEIIKVERRRRWSEADKQQIVAETLGPGASVSEVARRHGVHPSQVFTWRRTARDAALQENGTQFAPVVVRAERPRRSVPPAGVRLEIVLLSGRRVIVEGGVDPVATLGRVVDVLERR